MWASVLFSTQVTFPPWAVCPSSLLHMRITCNSLIVLVSAHMTLHGSPPAAAGAETAGDPLLPPISPSRLRPWKAPKKESSFAGAGFLAGVVCCKWKTQGDSYICVLTGNKSLLSSWLLLLAYPWEAVVAPELSPSDWPFSVLLGQYGLLSFPLAHTHTHTPKRRH